MSKRKKRGPDWYRIAEIAALWAAALVQLCGTDQLALPLLHYPGVSVPLESHEPHHVRRQGDQARLEEPRALAIRREQLQRLDLAAVRGDIREVQVPRGRGALPKRGARPTHFPPQTDSHPHAVQAYSMGSDASA